jgi:hypothetical protein
MTHAQSQLPEYIDGDAAHWVEPGSDYMRDPNIINTVDGVPTVEAMIRRLHREQDEEYWQ